MLTRRTVDVQRVNIHGQIAIENELIALQEYA
jgi:hypothetical protein